MKTDKKDIIIETAISCFNSVGFGAVSMNEIAREASLSRGNLAYHFKDKDVLLEAIVEKMWQRLKEKRDKSLVFPSFKNLEEELRTLYELQQEYAFVFLDSHVLKHPAIQPQLKEVSRQSIRDYKTFIAFSIKIGNMKPEPFQGLYHQLAFLSWMVSFYWFSQQTMRDDFSREAFYTALYSLLLPHFTEKGVASFVRFAGEEALSQMGSSFEHSMEDLLG